MNKASIELIGELSIPLGRFPMETVQRGTSSQTNKWMPHEFSHYVKTTFIHGLSLSEVDWGDLKRETT